MMAKKKRKTKKKAVAKKKAKPKKKAKAKKKAKGKKGAWTKADIAKLRKLFGNNPTAKVAKQLGRGTDAVKKKASRMGLKKSKRYMKSIGRA
jgi:membrane protein involved in colicin uptake